MPLCFETSCKTVSVGESGVGRKFCVIAPSVVWMNESNFWWDGHLAGPGLGSQMTAPQRQGQNRNQAIQRHAPISLSFPSTHLGLVSHLRQDLYQFLGMISLNQNLVFFDRPSGSTLSFQLFQ